MAWIRHVFGSLYFLIALILLGIALALVITTTWALVNSVLLQQPFLSDLLSVIDYVIIALAVFDVARFLYEEEVLHKSKARSLKETREALTKFITIMIIALSLEALVIIFDVKNDDQTKLIYPTLMFFVAVLATVGLVLFHWLSYKAELLERELRQLPTAAEPVPRYALIFTGERVAGKSEAQVKKALTSLLKIRAENTDKLFAGPPVTLMHNLSYRQALNYRLAFKQAGAVIQLQLQ